MGGQTGSLFLKLQNGVHDKRSRYLTRYAVFPAISMAASPAFAKRFTQPVRDRGYNSFISNCNRNNGRICHFLLIISKPNLIQNLKQKLTEGMIKRSIMKHPVPPPQKKERRQKKNTNTRDQQSSALSHS